MDDQKQYANELHKPAIKNFKRRQIRTYEINEIFGIDLVDMANLKEDNNNITFLLNVIDLYSRFVWSIPLKSKSAVDVLNAFKSIGNLPKKIWADEGKEFLNKEFLKFCKNNNIEIYHTFSGLKSVFIERFNRTLKENIYRYFSQFHTNEYINILPDLINDYNNKIHSSIKCKPFDVYFNKKVPKGNYDKIEVVKPKFNIGDFVRIAIGKRHFEKGYTQKWSKEVFHIIEIDDLYPVLYQLEDLNNERIDGKCYEQELQKTDLKDYAIIEKVLETKKIKGKKMSYVKYDGYSEKFNEWIDEKQLSNINGGKS
jgi:hypothetical protein